MNYQLVSADVVLKDHQTVADVAAGSGFLFYYVYAETTTTTVVAVEAETAFSVETTAVAANGLSFS